MRRHLKILAVTALAFTSIPGNAASTEVRVGQPLTRFNLLKPGVHRYVRYRIDDGKRTLIDIWERRISFEKHDGRQEMRIRQRWDAPKPQPGGLRILEQDSSFEPGTFRPLIHIRQETRDGPAVIKGYRFRADGASGLADLPNNSEAAFKMRFVEPAFNFEYDMELLQSLPLARGYAADIVFYDAGIDPKADHYVFKVAGSDDVVGWDGRLVHCWVVTADYNTGKVKSRFWFAKGSQVLIREVQELDGGARLIKTLLPPEPDEQSGS